MKHADADKRLVSEFTDHITSINSSDETETDIVPRPLPIPATPPVTLPTSIKVDYQRTKSSNATTVFEKLKDMAGSDKRVTDGPKETMQPNQNRKVLVEVGDEHTFENRIKEIASKLSDIGLLPIQADRIMSHVSGDYLIPHFDSPVDHHILYALQVCQGYTKSDISSHSVYSILVLIEALIEETMYLSQTFDKPDVGDDQQVPPDSNELYVADRNQGVFEKKSECKASDFDQEGRYRQNFLGPTTLLRKPEEEIKHSLQLELTHLFKENERLRSEITSSYSERGKLEEMLQKAISGDRSAIQREVEQMKVREQAEIHENHLRILGLQSTISRKDTELHYQHDIINRLQVEVKTLASIQDSQAANLAEKDRDNLVMKREGQALAIENATLKSELSNLRRRLDEEIQRADQAQQYAQTCQLANNELSADRRHLQENLVRIEAEVEQFRLDQTRMRQEVSLSHDENRRLKSQLQSLSCDVQNRVVNTAKVERIRDDLLRKCEVMKRSLQNQQSEKEKMIQQLNDANNAQEEKNRQVMELQRLLISSEEEVTSISSRIADVEKECSVLQNILEQERLKRYEYEELLSTGKAKEKAATEQIKALLKERAAFSTKLNEANVRLANASLRRSGYFSTNKLLDSPRDCEKANTTSSEETIIISDRYNEGSICDKIAVANVAEDENNEEYEGSILRYLSGGET